MEIELYKQKTNASDFCTYEGSGLSSSEPDIKKTAKGSNVTNGLAINGSSVDSARVKVQDWV